jgi:DNA-binding response OmpR family regulator
MTLSAILREEGHIVHTCASASLAVEAIKRHKPDVCILDIVMPGKSGFDIARDVRAMDSSQRPVLIAISGNYTKPSDKLLAGSFGFDHFLTKPAQPTELLALVNGIAGQSPAAA